MIRLSQVEPPLISAFRRDRKRARAKCPYYHCLERVANAQGNYIRACIFPA